MILASLLLLLVPLASARAVVAQQIPILDDNAVGEKEFDVAPVIGVQFTTSYALAAARYQNGTMRHLIRVEAGADYIGLMSRWMDSYPQRGLDHHKEEDIVGSPSPYTARALSDFFSKLHTAIKAELGIPFTHITPSIFPILQTQEQEFRDALIHSGLVLSKYPPAVYTEAEAAYAGLQSGARNTKQSKDVLFLSFDNSSFSATRRLFSCDHQSSMLSYVAHSELGWWNMPVDEAPRARFWTKVQKCIVDAISEPGTPPGRIVFLGSHGEHEEFRKVVEETFWNELELDIGMLTRGNDELDSARLAARGTAILAWRNGWQQRY